MGGKRGMLVLTLFAYFYPLATVLAIILTGRMAFWYDPARDMLLAADNLHKISLIGPPTGIPGIFYGPYWIWLLSLAELVNPDPRWAAFALLTVPYFTLFPYLLSKFRVIFPRSALVIVWLFFMLTTAYAGQIWNPHLAPLMYLGYLYLMVFLPKAGFNINFFWRILAIGVLCGLLINFHVSFGVAITLATGIFLTADNFIKKNGFGLWLAVIGVFAAGALVTFVPFAVFEMRHGFNQVQAFIFTMKRAVIDHSVVVGQTGLKKPQIVEYFVRRLGNLFTVPSAAAITLLFLGINQLVFAWRQKKLTFEPLEKRLLWILAANSAAILYLYLSNKNPVWEYHFIGVEIIMMFLIAIFIKKFPILKQAAVIWLGFIVVVNFYTYFNAFRYSATGSLSMKKQAVDIIFKDTGKQAFMTYAYNPALYTYDYDYLFRWLGERKYHTQAVTEPREAQNIYLILPIYDMKKSKQLDFIDYRTPNKRYQTAAKWLLPDNTLILKRVLK